MLAVLFDRCSAEVVGGGEGGRGMRSWDLMLSIIFWPKKAEARKYNAFSPFSNFLRSIL